MKGKNEKVIFHEFLRPWGHRCNLVIKSLKTMTVFSVFLLLFLISWFITAHKSQRFCDLNLELQE